MERLETDLGMKYAEIISRNQEAFALGYAEVSVPEPQLLVAGGPLHATNLSYTLGRMMAQSHSDKVR